MGKLQPKEADIQKSILDFLRLKKVFCWRNNTGAFAGEYKGKKRFVRFGFPGIADIIGVTPYRGTFASGDPDGFNLAETSMRFHYADMNRALKTKVGVLFAIEVKGPKGRPTSDQETFLWMVRESGGIAGVCRSVEDAKELLGL